MIILYAFKWVPDFAQGLVRDLRVRWALEEAGIPYGTKLLGQDDKDAPAYRSIQPWGQVPVIEEDDLVLFDIVTSDPVLGPYLARGEARPAFQRALAAQLAPFRENAPEMVPA
jgi:glutathione S-transferase